MKREKIVSVVIDFTYSSCFYYIFEYTNYRNIFIVRIIFKMLIPWYFPGINTILELIYI